MGRVIERMECERCGEVPGVCACAAGGVKWAPLAQPVTARYTDERYLLELLKAARKVVDASKLIHADPDALERAIDEDLLAAVLWVESDGLGPQALSGAAQLEL
jgi:hypothetical protein